MGKPPGQQPLVPRDKEQLPGSHCCVRGSWQVRMMVLVSSSSSLVPRSNPRKAFAFLHGAGRGWGESLLLIQLPSAKPLRGSFLPPSSLHVQESPVRSCHPSREREQSPGG